MFLLDLTHGNFSPEKVFCFYQYKELCAPSNILENLFLFSSYFIGLLAVKQLITSH